jgi:hypothetical protein
MRSATIGIVARIVRIMSRRIRFGWPGRRIASLRRRIASWCARRHPFAPRDGLISTSPVLIGKSD